MLGKAVQTDETRVRRAARQCLETLFGLLAPCRIEAGRVQFGRCRIGEEIELPQHGMALRAQRGN
jgi:hypothetical protein